MAASVKISAKAARYLLEMLDGGMGIYGTPHEDAEAELKAALAKATRASTTRRTLAKPKREKKAAKRVETSDIRAALVERAKGRCEACAVLFTSFLTEEMDHFFSRRHGQSVETCWLICGRCHYLKTRNQPSSASWLEVFALHAAKHGHSAEADRARKKLAWVEARGGA